MKTKCLALVRDWASALELKLLVTSRWVFKRSVCSFVVLLIAGVFYLEAVLLTTSKHLFTMDFSARGMFQLLCSASLLEHNMTQRVSRAYLSQTHSVQVLIFAGDDENTCLCQSLWGF